jgi:hypothetical protein
MRRIYVALLAVLAGLLTATGAVYAGINTIPPKVIVKSEGQYLQTARVHGHDWYYYNGSEYVHSDGKAASYHFPPVKAADSTKINLVFRFPARPENVYVRTLNRDFIAHTRFFPIKNENGKVVAWRTYFYRVGNHRYIINAKWAKAEGQSYGTAVYTAHVKTR